MSHKKCREWSNPSTCDILAKTIEALSRKWQKNCQEDLIWTQNGQKQVDQIFFRANCHKKKCREWYSSSKYEILAKTKEGFSRK